MLFLIFGTLCLITAFFPVTAKPERPHIIFIVADDLGWNDISWTNSKVKTPIIDSLAYNGMILNQTYMHHMCSPSRGAFMTGYYSFHTGLQNGWIRQDAPAGIPLRFEFLSQRLKRLGYSTHIIGKWHLGFCSWKYTPLERGFDSFLGFYTGSENYFSHSTRKGFDFRNNSDVFSSAIGKYSTELFSKTAVNIIQNSNLNTPLFMFLSYQAVHSPVQVPKRYENMYPNIKNTIRRKYFGMISAMDEGIGHVVDALKMKGMYDDSLIIFTSDNGAEINSGGNNWPFRGSKGNMFEGASKAIAFVHGKMLKNPGTVNNNLIHAVDWFPTILSVAKDPKIPTEIDGVDQWSVLQSNSTDKRNEIVYNIELTEDKKSIVQAAIRIRNFKLIIGYPGPFTDWYPEPETDENLRFKAKSIKNMTALYNLEEDPLERTDVKDKHPIAFSVLKKRLQELSRTTAPPVPVNNDPTSAPKRYGGVFTPGWCKAAL